MKIDMIGLAGALSYALDCIEAELVQVSSKHGKRVAYLSVTLAKAMNIKEEALQDLAICALLHDNALTQYLYEEFQNDLLKAKKETKLGSHCLYGEKNIQSLPFKTAVKDVLLYHHENANGTGPFHKTWKEVPLFARLIHLCDMMDIVSSIEGTVEEKWQFSLDYLNKQKGILFDEKCVELYQKVMSLETFKILQNNEFEDKLFQQIPRTKYDLNKEDIFGIVDFFTKIIDYKSEFTSRHSLGVAKKAYQLSQKMGYQEEDTLKMYLAGAFHDLGKMAVGNDILEKPARLTDEEYEKMKNHAGYTYLLLSEVNDFEEIRDWAAFHHEKLDGTGYPFGKTADELNEPERMMTCIDIYQALTEPRPYKEGMSHEKACSILEEMVEKGQLDAKITQLIKETFQ